MGFGEGEWQYQKISEWDVGEVWLGDLALSQRRIVNCALKNALRGRCRGLSDRGAAEKSVAFFNRAAYFHLFYLRFI